MRSYVLGLCRSPEQECAALTEYWQAEAEAAWVGCRCRCRPLCRARGSEARLHQQVTSVRLCVEISLILDLTAWCRLVEMSWGVLVAPAAARGGSRVHSAVVRPSSVHSHLVPVYMCRCSQHNSATTPLGG